VNRYCRLVLNRTWLCLALALTACASGPPSPRGVLLAYRAALQRNDPRAAYALLSSDEQRRLSFDEFSLRWRAAELERASLVRAEPQVVAERALVSRSGQGLALVREPGGWRLESARSTEPGLRSAADLLEELRRAFERRDGVALLRFLSPSLREAVERELTDRIGGLRDLSSRPLPTEADRLRLRYGSRFWVELERVDGGWRVRDLN
jgi:hypothetical protein